MNKQEVDIVIIGAGPVGLLCGYLAQISGLSTLIVDKSKGPLQVGRADALNARTLQLLEIVDLFSEVYPLGKQCNTSSVWENGKFISRQSTWWEEIAGCFHKHFLMLGQAHIENIIDSKLNPKVIRNTSVDDIKISFDKKSCTTTLSNGSKVKSNYVIGADGSRSFVRNLFKIPFKVVRPEIIWAVIDGVIDTTFPKVPEIIVFQAATADVAWIPREGQLDRFYIRMDKKDFSQEEVINKINKAMQPHKIGFKKVEWFSQFSVKESVAEHYHVQDRIFLAGDACHIHSVNGGQGLNTGIADAFNLIWKLSMVINHGAPSNLLNSYESERKPVAQSVIDSSGELVRSTKFSKNNTHAQDYVDIVRKRSGNITGMGISYSKNGLKGSRLYDFELSKGDTKTRIYSLLDYTKYSLLIFGEDNLKASLPANINKINIFPARRQNTYWTNSTLYSNMAVLVRPDSYIEFAIPIASLTGLGSTASK